MGLWKVISGIGKFLFEIIEEGGQKAQEDRAQTEAFKSEMKNYDNEQLVEILKDNGVFGASKPKRRAAFLILKERGVIPPKQES